MQIRPSISTTNLVFKSILVITSTVITARLSTKALYSSSNAVSVHWSSHSTQRQRKTVFDPVLFSKYQPDKTLFNTRFMVLLRNYFTRVTSKYAGINTIILTWFIVEELILKKKS